jgi:hypothetical protein
MGTPRSRRPEVYLDRDFRFRVKAVAPSDGPVVVALDETSNYGETDHELLLRADAEVVFGTDGRRWCPTARLVRFLQAEAADPSPQTHRPLCATARGTAALRSRLPTSCLRTTGVLDDRDVGRPGCCYRPEGVVTTAATGRVIRHGSTTPAGAAPQSSLSRSRCVPGELMPSYEEHARRSARQARGFARMGGVECWTAAEGRCTKDG